MYQFKTNISQVKQETEKTSCRETARHTERLADTKITLQNYIIIQAENKNIFLHTIFLI